MNSILPDLFVFQFEETEAIPTLRILFVGDKFMFK